MSVIVATREEVQEYYESDALGQSKLKTLLEGPSKFLKEFDSSGEHFLIGSAVDCILTSTQEEFAEQYYISKVEKKPSEAVISILTIVHNKLIEDYNEFLTVTSGEGVTTSTSFQEFVGELQTWETYIVDACLQVEWNSNWSSEAKVKNIIKSGAEYFQDLIKSFGKQILSSTQIELISSIVLSLGKHPRTANYFDKSGVRFIEEFGTPVVEYTIYYQFPIYFDYRGIKCKALLDIVIVAKDVEGKLLYVYPIDLKTMNGNTYNFPYSLRQRRYDIQAAWYTLALCHYFALPEENNIIKPFRFVVESTTMVGKPLVFQVMPDVLRMGRNGRKPLSLVDTNLFSLEQEPTVLLKEEVLGIEQLLDMYLYHSENGFYEEKAIQEAGLNPLLISWDGIVT